MDCLRILTLMMVLVEGPLIIFGKPCTLRTYYYDTVYSSTRVREIQTCEYGCCGMNIRYCCSKPAAGNESMPLGTKVGIIAGCVAAVVIIAVVVMCICRRKLQHSKQEEDSAPPYAPRVNNDAGNTHRTLQTSTAITNHGYDNHQFTIEETIQENKHQTRFENRKSPSNLTDPDVKPKKAGMSHGTSVYEEIPQQDDRPYDTSSTKDAEPSLRESSHKPKTEQHNTPNRLPIKENRDKPNHHPSGHVNEGYVHERKDPSYRKKLFGSQQQLATAAVIRRNDGLNAHKYKSEMYLASVGYENSLRQTAAKTFTASSHQLNTMQYHYKSTPNLYSQGPKLSLSPEIDFSEKTESRNSGGRDTKITSNERLRGSTSRLYPVLSAKENTGKPNNEMNVHKNEYQPAFVKKNEAVSMGGKTTKSTNEKRPSLASGNAPASENKKAPTAANTMYMTAPPTATITLPPGNKTIKDSSI